jgi:hypothetical protein
MKKIIVSLFTLGICLFSTNVFAAVFFDNFNDGNLDGWSSVSGSGGYYGNWRVENGILVEDQPGDGYVLQVNNFQCSDQVIETQLLLQSPAGYGGFAIWQQALNTLVAIRAYPGYGQIWVHEISNGTGNLYKYSSDFEYITWGYLKVNSHSANGDLEVYVDGKYLFTHTVSTDYRTGLSGLFCGNTGGSFDNFRLTSNDSNPVPEPASLILLGLSSLGMLRLRRKK